MHPVNTVEAKNNFNALVTQARHDKKPVIVKKRGEPVAVILDYETYLSGYASRQTAKKKSELVDELLRFHEYLKKQHPQGTGNSVEILSELREERDNR